MADKTRRCLGGLAVRGVDAGQHTCPANPLMRLNPASWDNSHFANPLSNLRNARSYWLSEIIRAWQKCASTAQQVGVFLYPLTSVSRRTQLSK